MFKRHMVLLSLFLSSFVLFAQVQTVKIQFTSAEVESMLFLYNQTQIKGADVEVVAPVGAKLRASLQQVRTMTDTTQTLTLQLTLVEVQVCLNIIQSSTFEAKYAELVLGMQKKLFKLIPEEMLQQK